VGAHSSPQRDLCEAFLLLVVGAFIAFCLTLLINGLTWAQFVSQLTN